MSTAIFLGLITIASELRSARIDEPLSDDIGKFLFWFLIAFICYDIITLVAKVVE